MDEPKIKLFWGCYMQVGNCWLWQPNQAINLSADEQYEINSRNDPNFRATIIRPSRAYSGNGSD